MLTQGSPILTICFACFVLVIMGFLIRHYMETPIVGMSWSGYPYNKFNSIFTKQLHNIITVTNVSKMFSVLLSD